jgi:hypothetical protein
MRHFLLLLGVIAAMAIGAPAYSQYVFMDVNGDGVNTLADVLTSSSTTVHVYFDTNHNRNGSTATCIDGVHPLDMVIYDFVVHASGSGSVTYGTYTQSAVMNTLGFTLLNPFTVSGANAGVGYIASNYANPGRYELGTFSVTVTGNPILTFVGSSTDPNIPSFGTGYATHCDATVNTNEETLGIDFFDADGTRSSTDTKSTTWGMIKQLYR